MADLKGSSLNLLLHPSSSYELKFMSSWEIKAFASARGNARIWIMDKRAHKEQITKKKEKKHW